MAKFTVIEVVVVIVIVGTLLAVAVPNFVAYKNAKMVPIDQVDRERKSIYIQEHFR